MHGSVRIRKALLLQLAALAMLASLLNGASASIINANLSGSVVYWMEKREELVRMPAVWAMVNITVKLHDGKEWRGWVTTMEDGFWTMGVPAGMAEVKATYGCAQAVVSGIEVPTGKAVGPVILDLGVLRSLVLCQPTDRMGQ